MEWIERLNKAMDYIEEHLTDEIDYGQLGRIACCSSYHFQRMFSYMAGMTLSEYIRKRKMSLAAVDLQGGDAKIVDVAEEYGYHSPTAFNRAFQAIHGVAPSAVKNEGVPVKSFLPISFKITIKGAEEMDYRIETREAKGVLGVCVCNDEEPWRYLIAVSSTAEQGKFETYTVPAATWAIFFGSGVGSSIQELEQWIVTEWLPTSGYEYGNAPDVEVYLNDDPQNAQYEVWIPVTKK